MSRGFSPRGPGPPPAAGLAERLGQRSDTRGDTGPVEGCSRSDPLPCLKHREDPSISGPGAMLLAHSFTEGAMDGREVTVAELIH